MFLLVTRVGLFREEKKKAIAKPKSTLEENMTKKERKKEFMTCPFFYSVFIKKIILFLCYKNTADNRCLTSL